MPGIWSFPNIKTASPADFKVSLVWHERHGCLRETTPKSDTALMMKTNTNHTFKKWYIISVSVSSFSLPGEGAMRIKLHDSYPDKSTKKENKNN